jgi:hypothetical protein
MFDFHPSSSSALLPAHGAEFFSLRYVRESGQYLSVRKNVAEPPSLSHDEGAMLTVRVNGVEAYAPPTTCRSRACKPRWNVPNSRPVNRPTPARPERPAGVQRRADYCRPISTSPSRP